MMNDDGKEMGEKYQYSVHYPPLVLVGLLLT